MFVKSTRFKQVCQLLLSLIVDPGRVLLLSTVFFLLTFIKFLTQNKDIWKKMHSRKKKGEKRTCAKKQAKFMIRHLSLLRINFSTL